MAFMPAAITTSLIACLAEEEHSEYKKPVSHTYSVSVQRAYELNVDRVVTQLVTALNPMAESKESTNISTWCHYYAFDVVSELTFSQPLEVWNDITAPKGVVRITGSSSFMATAFYKQGP